MFLKEVIEMEARSIEALARATGVTAFRLKRAAKCFGDNLKYSEKNKIAEALGEDIDRLFSPEFQERLIGAPLDDPLFT